MTTTGYVYVLYILKYL